jgi:ABC-2 type transport system ATP-binding protein
MIRARALTLKGRERPRLDGVDLDLERGVVYGLVGPNGAGKTSLLSVMARLTVPESGSVEYRLDGRPALVSAVIGGSGLRRGRTVRESLRLRAEYTAASRDAVEEALRDSGLGGVARRRVGALSLGMRARLAITGAVIGQPALVLFDEPMNGLDPDGMAWFRRVIVRERARGTTVVVSSHLLRELEQIIDVAVVMSQGRVTRVEDMRAVQRSGCAITVNDPERLVDALVAKGANARVHADRVLVDRQPPDVVNVAASLSIDVFAVERAGIELEELYLKGSTGEYLAEGGS